jgi:hypothetical protein
MLALSCDSAVAITCFVTFDIFFILGCLWAFVAVNALSVTSLIALALSFHMSR